LGKFNFRGKDILEDINAFQSPNDDLAKLFVDYNGPIILNWHNLNYRSYAQKLVTVVIRRRFEVA